jgi:hypothetical protein
VARETYVHNRPLTLVDPDGRAPQLVTVPGGALLGFGLGFAGYAVAQRISGGEFRLRDGPAAGAGGAVSGALAGATFETSLVASPVGTVLVGAGANAAGGAVARAVDSVEAGTTLSDDRQHHPRLDSNLPNRTELSDGCT